MKRLKPQPWYAKFNLPTWSPKNGRNRKPYPPTHGDPVDRTSDSARTIDPPYTLQPGGISFIYPFHDPKPPAPAIPYAGVRAGELIGYRMWWVIDGQLCSLAHRFIWEPNAVIEGDVDKVVMDRFPFQSPIYGGTYSFASPVLLAPELYRIDPAQLPAMIMFDPYVEKVLGVAIGTIKCWGEVVEHEKGYRAQYAKLQSIDWVIGKVDVNELKARYNV